MRKMQRRNKDKDQYLKFIAIIDIIMKNSDENHPLTVNQIKEKFYQQKRNFQIDYRAIKKYIEFYNEYYEDDVIQMYKKGRNLYFYFADRHLDMMEAKAIVDLVYSSDFFTLQTKKNYQKRIQDMFSFHYQSYFHKNLNPHITKNENSQSFYQELEVITKAIQSHKKIQFTYQKPTLATHCSKQTTLAPIDTLFSNNEYYLLCQGAKNAMDCILYRLDYIQDVKIIEDSQVIFSQMELEAFHEKVKNTTYMYGQGQLESIELEFHPSVYANMIDKFGKGIKPRYVDENHYRIQVKHFINNTFYSWIIGFGGAIQIVGGQSQIKRFQNFLKEQFL